MRKKRSIWFEFTKEFLLALTFLLLLSLAFTIITIKSNPQ